MNVYTFHNAVPGIELRERYTMLKIWQQSWIKRGWKPIILTPIDALQRSDYPKYFDKFFSFPTINPKEYEIACFIRWIAVLEAAKFTNQPSLMVDYDVLNNGFYPEDLTIQPFARLPVSLCRGGCPCALFGFIAQFENLIKEFVDYKPLLQDNINGRSHVSDQTIFAKICIDSPLQDLTRSLGEEGFEQAKLWHFNCAATTDRGLNRLDTMMKYL